MTYRLDDYQEGDNDFVVEAEIQMADSITSIDGSVHVIGTGARVGSAIIIMDRNMKVSRTNTEVPDLLLTVTSDTEVTYDSK